MKVSSPLVAALVATFAFAVSPSAAAGIVDDYEGQDLTPAAAEESGGVDPFLLKDEDEDEHWKMMEDDHEDDFWKMMAEDDVYNGQGLHYNGQGLQGSDLEAFSKETTKSALGYVPAAGPVVPILLDVFWPEKEENASKPQFWDDTLTKIEENFYAGYQQDSIDKAITARKFKHAKDLLENLHDALGNLKVKKKAHKMRKVIRACNKIVNHMDLTKKQLLKEGDMEIAYRVPPMEIAYRLLPFSVPFAVLHVGILRERYLYSKVLRGDKHSSGFDRKDKRGLEETAKNYEEYFSYVHREFDKWYPNQIVVDPEPPRCDVKRSNYSTGCDYSSGCCHFEKRVWIRVRDKYKGVIIESGIDETSVMLCPDHCVGLPGCACFEGCATVCDHCDKKVGRACRDSMMHDIHRAIDGPRGHWEHQDHIHKVKHEVRELLRTVEGLREFAINLPDPNDRPTSYSPTNLRGLVSHANSLKSRVTQLHRIAPCGGGLSENNGVCINTPGMWCKDGTCRGSSEGGASGTKCGKGERGDGGCADRNLCCSKNGYCGLSELHCTP